MQFDLGVGDTAVALVAIAVFLGHLWPVFFRFVGGKGVATALGVLLGINPWLGLATLATWLIIAYAFRYSSLAALVAALFAPFYYGLLFGVDAILLSVVVMSVLLAYRHSQNIANLLAGKESKIGAKKDAAKACVDIGRPARIWMACGAARCGRHRLAKGCPMSPLPLLPPPSVSISSPTFPAPGA